MLPEERLRQDICQTPFHVNRTRCADYLDRPSFGRVDDRQRPVTGAYPAQDVDETGGETITAPSVSTSFFTFGNDPRSSRTVVTALGMWKSKLSHTEEAVNRVMAW